MEERERSWHASRLRPPQLIWGIRWASSECSGAQGMGGTLGGTPQKAQAAETPTHTPIHPTHPPTGTQRRSGWRCPAAAAGLVAGTAENSLAPAVPPAAVASEGLLPHPQGTRLLFPAVSIATAATREEPSPRTGPGTRAWVPLGLARRKRARLGQALERNQGLGGPECQLAAADSGLPDEEWALVMQGDTHSHILWLVL